MCNLIQNNRCSWKAAFALAIAVARALNSPDQARFDGCRRLVEIGAIEAQACFEAQGVPCAKTDWCNRLVFKQRGGDIACPI